MAPIWIRFASDSLSARFGRQGWVAAWLVLSCLSARSAAAAELDWVAPSTCVATEALREEAEVLARTPGPTLRMNVAVQIRVSDGRWLGQVETKYADGRRGVRAIEAGSCAELRRAISVTLSLLEGRAVPSDERQTATGEAATEVPQAAASSSPQAALAAPLAEPVARAHVAQSENAVAPTLVPMRGAPGSVVPGSVVPGSVVPDDRPPDAEEGASRSRLGLELGLSSLLAVEGARSIELGAALSNALWLGSWGVRLQGVGQSQLGSLEASHQIDVRLSRFSGALEACHRWDAAAFALCSGFRLERIQADAPALGSAPAETMWLPAIGAAALFALPAGHGFAYTAELQGHTRLQRATLSAEPWGVVYTLPGWDALLLVGATFAP